MLRLASRRNSRLWLTQFAKCLPQHGGCTLQRRGCHAGGDHTVADILLATVLREIRKTDLIDPYPRLKAYYARALGRPARAAHPQPPLRTAGRDRHRHSLRLRTVEIAPPGISPSAVYLG